MTWILVTLIVLIILAGWMVYILSRSLGYELRKSEEYEEAEEIEEERNNIGSRPSSNADDLLGRMRSEVNDN